MKPEKFPEVVDEMRLIIKPAFQGNTAPMNGPVVFYFLDRFLKTHDLEILFWGYAHLFLEQVNKMLLRISYLTAELLKARGWLAGSVMLDTAYSIHCEGVFAWSASPACCNKNFSISKNI